MAADTPPDRTSSRAACPICGRAAEPGCRPFCSARCRDQDLLNWLDGRYAVPAIEADDEEEETQADQGA